MAGSSQEYVSVGATSVSVVVVAGETGEVGVDVGVSGVSVSGAAVVSSIDVYTVYEHEVDTLRGISLESTLAKLKASVVGVPGISIAVDTMPKYDGVAGMSSVEVVVTATSSVTSSKALAQWTTTRSASMRSMAGLLYVLNVRGARH